MTKLTSNHYKAILDRHANITLPWSHIWSTVYQNWLPYRVMVQYIVLRCTTYFSRPNT